jgi:hypothetical protein
VWTFSDQIQACFPARDCHDDNRQDRNGIQVFAMKTDG